MIVTMKIKKIFPLFFLLLIGATPGPTKDSKETTNGYRDAIVKVYTVVSQPDYYNPWRTLPPSHVSGSGAIIEGNKILTNAHVIANQKLVEVRRQGEAKKYIAKVLSVSHDADLALLTVEDPLFFKDIKPLTLGELPETQSEVVVYGFPIGGDSLSITKGVLSRLEHQYYSHSSYNLLAGQIDASINPGNSGGPVLVDGKVAGVVMQVQTNAENIGYMIPVSVVKHFLKDIEDGKYDGFPSDGLSVQPMENDDFKKKYGMTETQTGVLVRDVLPGMPENLFKKGDVLLKVDGHEIADDGTVEFRKGDRTFYNIYLDEKQVGESVTFDVLRETKTTQVTLKLDHTQESEWLVPWEAYDVMPQYYIVGGVVLTPLTKNLLLRWGNKAPSEFLVKMDDWKEEPDEEVVVILQILPDETNRGYEDFTGGIIKKVNGKKIKNLKDMVTTIETSQDPYIILEGAHKSQVVLDRKKVAERKDTILQNYLITKDRSVGL